MTNKKKGLRIILITFVFIICSVIIWRVLINYVNIQNYENRVLAEAPSLTSENYETFAEEFNLYFNDNMPFRSALITLNSSIDYFVFNRSSNENVVVGKNNWLFYSNVADGDPIASYQGTNLYPQEILYGIAQNLIAQRDFLASQGVEFVLFIAPNKERVYYENMPDIYGLPAADYKVKQVVDYLRATTDIRVVYPYDELMNAKALLNENVYYVTDTHWNKVGGYIGASALLEELGVDMPAVYGDEISVIQGDHISGDLAAMLNLSKQLEFADYDYMVEGYNTHNIEMTEYGFDTMISYRAEGADPRTIYVDRDSFSTAMCEYIGSQFSESYLRHNATYTYDDYASHNPDIFVYEVVERAVDALMNFSVQ